MPAPLRIAVLAPARFPIREPFAGGLEAHTWQLATGLRTRGHDVTVFAAAGSDPSIGVHPFLGGAPVFSEAARADVSFGPAATMAEHHAYLSTMVELARHGADRFDVVHNNSVHHLPIAMAAAVDVAQVTTLHTPPTAWMELALQGAVEPSPIRFCAVSAHTAAAWSSVVPAVTVVPNAVDLRAWPVGPGGTDAVWSGRIVPEKGAHLAIAAARHAGLRLTLAGPIHDDAYWRSCVEPELGPDVRWAGHLDRVGLAQLVGRSAVALVSPCWDEPFGLVALEALACGTPVAAFGRGGLLEVLDDSCSRLARNGDGDARALGEAAMAAASLERAAARRRAEALGSVERMVDRYVECYREAVGAPMAAAVA